MGVKFMINRAGGLPIYLQIAYQLRDDIISNVYAENDKIPAEDEIASSFGVSRMTARNAVTYLVNEGLVYRMHGKGAFVSQKKLGRTLNKLNYFHEDVKELGKHPSCTLLEFIERKSSQREQQILNINKVQPVLDIKQICYVDGQPLGTQNFIVPRHFVPELKEEDLEHDFFQSYVTDAGYPLETAEQRMESVLAPEVAQLIGVPKEEPFFYYERVSYTKGQLPILLIHTYFYGKKYSFTITLSKK